MRPQGNGPRDTPESAVPQADPRSQETRVPEGCVRRRRLQGEGDHPLYIGVRDGVWVCSEMR